ncbi:MAG: hypothetical protein ACSLFP_04560 [Acidimicrobiales bacterium]
MSFSRRLASLGAAALLTTTVVACGDDDSPDASADPTTTTAAVDDTTSTTASSDTTASDTTAAGPTGLDGELPPPGPFDIEPIYGEILADLGLRLTSQGGLIDRSGGGYVPSAEGDHLAIYVEPIGDDYDAEDYIQGIHTVAVVFQDVFERWPGLATYDVCQEPGEGWRDGYADRQLPVTQIELTREEAEALGDLEQLGVVDLVRAAQTDPPGMALRVSSRIARDPGYQAILAEAEA